MEGFSYTGDHRTGNDGAVNSNPSESDPHARVSHPTIS